MRVGARSVCQFTTPLGSPCQVEDCWSLRRRLRAGENYRLFDHVWSLEKATARAEDRKPSLLKALSRAFIWDFFPSVPLLIGQNLCQLSMPYILGPLILFIGSDQPSWVGYSYALGFFVGIMATTLFENQCFDVCTKTGVRIRGALVPTIFRHRY